MVAFTMLNPLVLTIVEGTVSSADMFTPVKPQMLRAVMLRSFESAPIARAGYIPK
jgi:hypothetical protein